MRRLQAEYRPGPRTLAATGELNGERQDPATRLQATPKGIRTPTPDSDGPSARTPRTRLQATTMDPSTAPRRHGRGETPDPAPGGYGKDKAAQQDAAPCGSRRDGGDYARETATAAGAGRRTSPQRTRRQARQTARPKATSERPPGPRTSGNRRQGGNGRPLGRHDHRRHTAHGTTGTPERAPTASGRRPAQRGAGDARQRNAGTPRTRRRRNRHQDPGPTRPATPPRRKGPRRPGGTQGQSLHPARKNPRIPAQRKK